MFVNGRMIIGLETSSSWQNNNITQFMVYGEHFTKVKDLYPGPEHCIYPVNVDIVITIFINQAII